MNLLIEPYLSRDGVIAMAAATFALGLIVGALVMEFTHGRAARRPRPARVRPVGKPAARHRATMPMKGGQVVLGGNQPRPQVQEQVPGPPPRGQGGVSGGGHPQPVRIDVRA